MSERIFLLAVLVLSLAGFVRAQETTGPKADEVKKEIIKLEEDKLRAFQSTGTSHNFCPDWVKSYDAEGIVHINADGTEDTKAGLMSDVQNGNRKLLAVRYGPQNIRVYGDGGNGTTAVTTYSTLYDIEVYGKQSRSEEHHVVDVWVNREGKWWFVVHSVHSLPSPEAVKLQAEKTKGIKQ
jgi:hypothetical protein